MNQFAVSGRKLQAELIASRKCFLCHLCGNAFDRKERTGREAKKRPAWASLSWKLQDWFY
jgi:hypothetical protein